MPTRVRTTSCRPVFAAGRAGLKTQPKICRSLAAWELHLRLPAYSGNWNIGKTSHCCRSRVLDHWPVHVWLSRERAEVGRPTAMTRADTKSQGCPEGPMR